MDYDDHSTTAKATEDCAVAGGDGSPTQCGADESGGDDNPTSRVNDVCDETARTATHAYIPVGDRVDIFMHARVTGEYTTSEPTAATKHGEIDDTLLRRNNESVPINRPVANAVVLHFVN